METFLEILKITIPALLVMLTAWLVIRNMLRDDQERRRQDLLLQTVKTLTPVRLQAYERVVLFLERISPESLIIRTARPEMTAQQLQAALVTAVRSEYEHNLSQQIYVSSELWVSIKDAYENVIQLINTCASQCQAEESAAKLATMIIKLYDSVDETALDVAMQVLKDEVKEII